jgi:hypothetical protein
LTDRSIVIRERAFSVILNLNLFLIILIKSLQSITILILCSFSLLSAILWFLANTANLLAKTIVAK